jgi:hypothetical protein
VRWCGGKDTVMELSSPMLNPSVPPQQIPPDELWFGPSPGEFAMEGRTSVACPLEGPAAEVP